MLWVFCFNQAWQLLILENNTELVEWFLIAMVEELLCRTWSHGTMRLNFNPILAVALIWWCYRSNRLNCLEVSHFDRRGQSWRYGRGKLLYRRCLDLSRASISLGKTLVVIISPWSDLLSWQRISLVFDFLDDLPSLQYSPCDAYPRALLRIIRRESALIFLYYLQLSQLVSSSIWEWHWIQLVKRIETVNFVQLIQIAEF